MSAGGCYADEVLICDNSGCADRLRSACDGRPAPVELARVIQSSCSDATQQKRRSSPIRTRRERGGDFPGPKSGVLSCLVREGTMSSGGHCNSDLAGVEDVQSRTPLRGEARRHYARDLLGSGASRPLLRVLRLRRPFQVRLLREACLAQARDVSAVCTIKEAKVRDRSGRRKSSLSRDYRAFHN